MTLFFLKYFVTLTCGIANLGSLKTIWIFGKVYNPFIILELIPAFIYAFHCFCSTL